MSNVSEIWQTTLYDINFVKSFEHFLWKEHWVFWNVIRNGTKPVWIYFMLTNISSGQPEPSINKLIVFGVFRSSGSIWAQFHQHIYVQLLFTLLGSTGAKAAHRTLMKLTPGDSICLNVLLMSTSQYHQWPSCYVHFKEKWKEQKTFIQTNITFISGILF